MSEWIVEGLGWFSSLILVVVTFKQIHKQWSEKRAEGVSKWLFGGQICSCAGFSIYSYLVDNWVFVFTNTLLFITNIVGFYLTSHFRKAGNKSAKA